MSNRTYLMFKQYKNDEERNRIHESAFNNDCDIFLGFAPHAETVQINNNWGGVLALEKYRKRKM